MTGKIIRPFGPTLYKGAFSEKLRLEVLEKSASSRQSAAKNLAGNIEKELFIDFSRESEDELKSIVKEYLDLCYNAGLFKPQSAVKNIKFEKIWVNHQTKGEWNPPHVHSGDFSMVGYCQIPEQLKDEWKFENQQGQNPTGGKIQWQYGTSAPHNMTSFGPMMPEQGAIYIFPAWLLHFVYPFNSDVTRISFSTNCNLVY
jgi:uncharacterized protein (TIGR02466 family)